MITFNYCLNNYLSLTRVNQTKILEFLYVPSLKFHPHIDYIVCKIARVLVYIKQHSSNLNSPKCLSVLCCD